MKVRNSKSDSEIVAELKNLDHYEFIASGDWNTPKEWVFLRRAKASEVGSKEKTRIMYIFEEKNSGKIHYFKSLPETVLHDELRIVIGSQGTDNWKDVTLNRLLRYLNQDNPDFFVPETRNMKVSVGSHGRKGGVMVEELNQGNFEKILMDNGFLPDDYFESHVMQIDLQELVNKRIISEDVISEGYRKFLFDFFFRQADRSVENYALHNGKLAFFDSGFSIRQDAGDTSFFKKFELDNMFSNDFNGKNIPARGNIFAYDFAYKYSNNKGAGIGLLEPEFQKLVKITPERFEPAAKYAKIPNKDFDLSQNILKHLPKRRQEMIDQFAKYGIYPN